MAAIPAQKTNGLEYRASKYEVATQPFYDGIFSWITPTCSEYATQAVDRYGAFQGIWLAAKRLLRCQPFCEGGHDPVK
jgi:putative membrane protein insertion efficiency factor